MVDWYMETKEMRYLTQAKVVWRYLIDHGWDETCGGGVHWKELNEHTTSKHSCSTGPTAVMGCKMYQATQEQEYLDWAIKCYDYMLDVLQDKSDHLFYDNVRPNKDDPNLPGDLEKTSIPTTPDNHCRQPVSYIRLPANRNIWMKRMRLLKAVIRNGLCPIVPKS